MCPTPGVLPEGFKRGWFVLGVLEQDFNGEGFVLTPTEQVSNSLSHYRSVACRCEKLRVAVSLGETKDRGTHVVGQWSGSARQGGLSAKPHQMEYTTSCDDRVSRRMCCYRCSGFLPPVSRRDRTYTRPYINGSALPCTYGVIRLFLTKPQQ